MSDQERMKDYFALGEAVHNLRRDVDSWLQRVPKELHPEVVGSAKSSVKGIVSQVKEMENTLNTISSKRLSERFLLLRKEADNIYEMFFEAKTSSVQISDRLKADEENSQNNDEGDIYRPLREAEKDTTELDNYRNKARESLEELLEMMNILEQHYEDDSQQASGFNQHPQHQVSHDIFAQNSANDLPIESHPHRDSVPELPREVQRESRTSEDLEWRQSMTSESGTSESVTSDTRPVTRRRPRSHSSRIFINSMYSNESRDTNSSHNFGDSSADANATKHANDDNYDSDDDLDDIYASYSG